MTPSIESKHRGRGKISHFTDQLDEFAERLSKDGYPTALIERASARMKQLEEQVVAHYEFQNTTEKRLTELENRVEILLDGVRAVAKLNKLTGVEKT